MKNLRKFAFGTLGLGMITLMALTGKVSGEVAVKYLTYCTLGVMGGYVGEYVFGGIGQKRAKREKKGKK